MTFLEVKNVCKGFGRTGKRNEVLEDINLRVEAGEFRCHHRLLRCGQDDADVHARRA